MDIEAHKAECRKSLAKSRKEAKAKHKNAEASLIKQFFSIELFDKTNWHGKLVAGYLPIASEINVLPLLAELRTRGAVILLPAIVGKDEPLQFRTWHEGDPLIEESFGTMAPSPSAEVHLPDIILSPLLGFDDSCYRLGYGGGFYDRSLQSLRLQKPSSEVIAFGLAYDEQKLDNVPRDSHDIRLHGIITPSCHYLGEAF